MSYESSFRSSSTVLTAAILILSSLAILSGAKLAVERYPWLISGILRSDVPAASNQIRGQFEEFSASAASQRHSTPRLQSTPERRTPSLEIRRNSSSTSVSAAHVTATNIDRTQSSSIDRAPSSTAVPTSTAGASGSLVPSVSVPHVTVPVTVNVNNGELLSELLKVQQQLHELQNSGPTALNSSDAICQSERVFHYEVHDQSSALASRAQRNSPADLSPPAQKNDLPGISVTNTEESLEPIPAAASDELSTASVKTQPATADLTEESSSFTTESILATDAAVDVETNAIPFMTLINEWESVDVREIEPQETLPTMIPATLPELSIPVIAIEKGMEDSDASVEMDFGMEADANLKTATDVLTGPETPARTSQLNGVTMPPAVPMSQATTVNDSHDPIPEIIEPPIRTGSSFHDPLPEAFASATPSLLVPTPELTPMPDRVPPVPSAAEIPYGSYESEVISDDRSFVEESPAWYSPPVLSTPPTPHSGPSKRAVFANNSLQDMRDRLTGFLERAPRPDFEPPHWMDDLSDWPEQSARAASKWFAQAGPQNSSQSSEDDQRRSRSQEMRQAQHAWGKPGMTASRPSKSAIAANHVPERSYETAMQFSTPGVQARCEHCESRAWDPPMLETPTWVENVSATDSVDAIRNSRTLHRVTSAVRFATRPRTLD